MVSSVYLFFQKELKGNPAAVAVALHVAHYNFRRVYQTLRVMPTMEAGLSNHVWEIEERVNLLPR